MFMIVMEEKMMKTYRPTSASHSLTRDGPCPVNQTMAATVVSGGCVILVHDLLPFFPSFARA